MGLSTKLTRQMMRGDGEPRKVKRVRQLSGREQQRRAVARRWGRARA